MSKLTLIEGTGEWSALYVDGKLERVGDHYYVHERLFDLTGVEVLEQTGDDFMLGNYHGGRDEVAQTLADIKSYEAGRQERLLQASALRRQATEFLEQAEELER